MRYSLGVDLGTTFVAAAMVSKDRPQAEMVTLSDRSVVIPSVVYLGMDGLLVCGEVAARQAVAHPERAAVGFKRRLGDPTPLRLGTASRPATELLAEMLKEVLRAVTASEGHPPAEVVLTHPAHWGPFRREIFEEVARLAGLAEVSMITEPEAAAVHYWTSRELREGQLIAVYDLGGGTFDATILRARPAGSELVGTPEGIERLGGMDFDAALFAHIDHEADGCLTQLDPHDARAAVALFRARQDCVLAKEALSVDSQTAIPVFLPDRTFDVTVTRESFEGLIRAHIESTVGALQRTLRSAQLNPEDLEAVLLVGGSSRIPLVAKMVSAAIGRPIVVDSHPKYAVALGAASVAARSSVVAPSNTPHWPIPEAAKVLAPSPLQRDSATPVQPKPQASNAFSWAAKPAAEASSASHVPAPQPRAESASGFSWSEKPLTGVSSQSAVSRLEAVAEGTKAVVMAGKPFVIGRGAGAGLNLSSPAVSRQHGILTCTDGEWTYTDASRNGTYLDGAKVTQVRVERTMTLMLGDLSNGVRVELILDGAAPKAAVDPNLVRRVTAQGRLTNFHQLPATKLRIGRLPDNDVVLDDLLVSRRHAELRRAGAGWELVDLSSANGTFVNGRRVTTSAIGPRDLVGIGRALLQLDGDRLVECVDDGDNAFAAHGVTVITDSGVTLVHDVSFGLGGKALMAVVGPSGAGKSTLLYALVGSRPAQRGEVRYAERSLYDDYDELRHRVALVPQDDVLHTQLTVAAALRYAAQLRFPADTTSADREQRVREVLGELGLAEHAHKPVTALSGGQRKRTSVALELLTKPSLLFLDEPTSGLDPGMDRSVMQTLRTLADDDRTVVVVTHNVANLEVCDRLLLLAKGGWLAYFGPPAEALDYFGEKDYADIFLRLDSTSGEQWAAKYRASPQYQRYLGTASQRPPGPEHSHAAPLRPPRQQGPLTQLSVLARRYLAVIGADRQYLGFLAALPIVLSLLARSVPGSAGLSVLTATADPAKPDPQPAQLLLVLIIGAALMGAAAAIRELVKERTIYQRERAVGLSVGAYLLSKVLVLSLIVTLQVTAFTVLALAGRNVPDNTLVVDGHLEIFIAVLAAGLVTMMIGLAISGVIRNADQGMPLLVLMVMAQLVFSGGLFAVHGRPGLEQLAWLAPSRWAYAMTAATAELTKLDRPGTEPDPLWEHVTSTWIAAATVLGVMVALLTAAIAWSLLRLDPKRRR